MPVTRAQISAHPLSLDAHVDAVTDATRGAIVTFLGTVRDHDPEARNDVVALEYSAHPDAEGILFALAEQALGSVKGSIAVSHRIGRLAVGDAAVAIAVSSAHRAEAFEVCRALIEAIKHELPVWKKQIESDGTSSWLGLGG